MELLSTARDISAGILERVDAMAIWLKLLRSKREKIVLESMIYLMDRVYGKPIQMVQGDPTKPLSINLQWGGAPEWMHPRDVTPDPSRAILEALLPTKVPTDLP